jgi:hypothetical protein
MLDIVLNTSGVPNIATPLGVTIPVAAARGGFGAPKRSSVSAVKSFSSASRYFDQARASRVRAPRIGHRNFHAAFLQPSVVTGLYPRPWRRQGRAFPLYGAAGSLVHNAGVIWR